MLVLWRMTSVSSRGMDARYTRRATDDRNKIYLKFIFSFEKNFVSRT